ncbi:Uncharacterised protein [Yersinia pseudotuberculosis]|uniref:Uncharacterized protein n=2 Tax=Yersinia TaxID=629 RepID=A0A0T9QKM8_9GAMM|nr:Uncharacterised protein [Yersinia pseudotuberculosis]CNI16553.1 Uncharacterised protein [Yersinia similis]CNI64385.1 Uncharacterised protein [Yersinia pseudotuberculosis]CNJ06541.1 Uncharacterised protein [Yersinia pseudotuberculosis]SUQ17621.1 Uncharacterised protein [Yersinia pseudotuberculosis]
MAYQGEVLLRASFDGDSEEDEFELSNLAFCKLIELRKYLEDLMVEVKSEAKP